MSFGARMVGARKAEDIVLQQLRDAGWNAFEFGQALMPEEFRDALKGYKDHCGRPSLVRWFPDVIAFKRHELMRTRVILFDVKSDSGRTDNFAIEIKALEACEAFQQHFFTPCWFIYEGLIVLTPEAVRENCWGGPPPSDAGSGTPYVLINKSHAKKLDLWLM